MKIRTLLLIVGILVLAGFTALNLDEFLRPTTLNLAFSQVQAPLGLVLLGVVALVLVFFLITLVILQTTHLMEVRRATKDATEQRQLADKAEQSRFVELGQRLDQHMKDSATREAELAAKTLARLEQVEAKLITSMEQTANGLAAAIGEVDDRLDRIQAKPAEASR